MADEPNHRLMEAMEKLVQDYGRPGKALTRQEIEDRTGISKTTIQMMLREGHAPHAEYVIRLAKSYNQDIAEWLDLCGYPDIAEDYRGKIGSVQSDELDRWLAPVPEAHRRQAREAVRTAARTLIVPIYEALV